MINHAVILRLGTSINRIFRAISPSVFREAAMRESQREVDAASVIAFRSIFGLVALVAVVRFFGHGWIDSLYIDPAYRFTYLGISWAQPWPGWGMYAHFTCLGLLSVGMVAGYRPRLCSALFFLGFTYVELLDRTTYLNHHYLMSLISLLLAFLPLHRRTVPAWAIWALRAQVGVVYVFAGIAKLNPDWLLNAAPMRIWLYHHGDLPIIGAALQEVWVAYAMSWSGALFDLAIFPAMLWRRSRPFAYGCLVAFHLATWMLFPQLGLFPWLMIGLATIFFAPDWPVLLLRAGRVPVCRYVDATRPTPTPTKRWVARITVVALALFVAVQLALPLRHYLYPANVRWTEEGYLFAWRVMLTEKVGFVQYRVREVGTGQSWLVEPGEYLTPTQSERMAFQPELIRQTAHLIRDDFASRGHGDVIVAADAFVAFNGRPNVRLIDPTVDLATVRPGIGPKPWVVPHGADVPTARRSVESAEP